MMAEDPDKSTAEPQGPLFREEALSHHLGESEEGDVLRLSPRWTRWTYWFLVVVVVVGLSYLFFGTVPEYLTGQAVLQVEGRVPLTASSAGVIESVEVHPGQNVVAGQVLVRLRAEMEQAELGRLEREFELRLVERLRDPNNTVAGSELTRLRAEKELLQARLDERTIKAPRDGVVHDVRIGAGDFLKIGEPVLSLVGEDANYKFIAILPGHTLPQLEKELEMRLEIQGYPYAYVAARIESVGKQIIGPSEAAKFLGPEASDTIGLHGPVVIVEGRPLTNEFRATGRRYSLHDGMIAVAEIKLRRERVLYLLLPSLKALDRRNDG